MRYFHTKTQGGVEAEYFDTHPETGILGPWWRISEPGNDNAVYLTKTEIRAIYEFVKDK